MAERLFKDADAKTKKIFMKDFEGAMELFEKAGAQFKLDKDYNRAGDAYMRSGDCAIKVGDVGAACQAYTNSANCYKKVDMKKASTILDVAVNLNIENNRLNAAARLEKDFADALDEADEGMSAIPHYEKAIRFFEAEDMKAQSQACYVKIAKIYGENDKFNEAVELYEQLGSRSVNGPLKHQAKEFFMRAMLCRFALVTADNRGEKSVECMEALEGYKSIDIYLKNTREEEFLQRCAEAVEGADIEKFEIAVSLLNELRMLDDWKTHVLLVVKQNMESIL